MVFWHTKTKKEEPSPASGSEIEQAGQAEEKLANDGETPAMPPPTTTTTTTTKDGGPTGGATLEHTEIQEEEDHMDYPEGWQLYALILSVFVSMFLVALDRLIISTALPEITDEFHSITDIGWYGSAYLFSTCATQLMFGKLYTFFAVKGVFLAAIILFEVGSAVCGAAPSSVAFIVGRAIQGVGAAGIFAGAVVVIVYAVPLHRRPLFQGAFGAVFGIASVAGPLLGGVFTTNVTWRWCFYINLPIGGVAMVFIYFLLKVPDRKTTRKPFWYKIKQLDILGTVFLVPGTVCIILCLQWGGVDYAWNSWRCILLLTLGGVLLIAFVVVQIVFPDTATVPPRIMRQQSIAAGTYATVCLGSAMMVLVYYIPIWFQAIKDVSAVDSGIRLLPMVLSLVVASGISGALIHRVGYYTPVMIFGTCVMAVGAGLITMFEVDTPQSQWIAYQFVYGFGLGFTFQAPNIGAQTVLKPIDVSIGVALMFFGQMLGGAIFISVGQNVLTSELVKQLSKLPLFDEDTIRSYMKEHGALDFTDFPDSVKPQVVSAYNEALRQVFVLALAMSCITIFGSLAMEWRTVKQDKDKFEKHAKDVEEKAVRDGGGGEKKGSQDTQRAGDGSRPEADEEGKSAEASADQKGEGS
ncbi:putative mfs aflatoxin efflux protein [Zalerion maritima]|uniref:Mfs aflatoxin efflux protein n=1 Tax=Zalerion maritima TaxID=339359 RepID=A0AAD5WT12_9PEZI|nr:putative mfs aflatoxin efflux protein [Zalerion maritima]